MLTRRAFVGGLPLALSATAVGSRLTREQDRFLEDLSHRCFLFLWEQADAGTGLVLPLRRFRDRRAAGD
jgi:hypothetical protein